jgi:antitoxin component of MazEF toxin-antitoxin module
MDQKVLRTGNSLAVSIPAEFAKALGVQAGDTVKIKPDAVKGVLTYTFRGSGQLTLLPSRK